MKKTDNIEIIEIRQDKSRLTVFPEPLKDVWAVTFRNKDGFFTEEFETFDEAVEFVRGLE